MHKIVAHFQIIPHCGIIKVNNIWILGMKIIVPWDINRGNMVYTFAYDVFKVQSTTS